MTDNHRDDRAERYGDRERILDEAPDPTLIDGLWFTVDDQAPGGVRPVTEAEYRAFRDQVAATTPRERGRTDLADADQRIQQARDNLDADAADGRPPGDCRIFDYMSRQRDGLDDVDEPGDGRGDLR